MSGANIRVGKCPAECPGGEMLGEYAGGRFLEGECPGEKCPGEYPGGNVRGNVRKGKFPGNVREGEYPRECPTPFRVLEVIGQFELKKARAVVFLQWAREILDNVLKH